jgi:hypothetical protein
LAKHRPRKPRPARGLPPRDPVYDAETERIRRELEADCIRLDALLIEKKAEAAERARIKALAQQAQAESEADTGDADLWY